MNDAFSEQASPAGYYRWLVVTRYLGLPANLDSAVLDVGAHNGSFLDRVTAELTVGLDLLKWPAQAQAWTQANARRLPFADNSFGHVIACDILEHIEQDLDVLSEIVRVLKRGGTLWLSTPSAEFYLFPGGRLQQRFERAWGHVRHGYTPSELRSKLPACLVGEFLPWNESAFRHLYAFVKAVHALSPVLSRHLTELIYAWDARHITGKQGHWFAKLQKEKA